MWWSSSMLAVAGWLVALAAVRLLVAAPEDCRKATPEEMLQTAEGALGWLERAGTPGGRYVYIYDRERDLLPNDYNEVRHAGVTLALYQGAARFDDPDALAAADNGLEWMLARLVRHDDWAALLSPDGRQAKLGGTALLAAGLAERRIATGDPRYDELLHELGRFMVALQRPDGSFQVVWDVGSERADPDLRSKYSPGEAFWALTLLHRVFPGEGWDTPARAAADYLATRRDDEEDIRFPPWNDQWAAYGLAEMASWGLTDGEVAYARSLAGRFGLFVRSESQWEGGGLVALVRPGPARGSAAGTWIEGLAALWRLAAGEPRLADLQPALEDRLACLGGVMAARQADEQMAATAGHPELVRGAWFTEDGETRMDDQQHVLSGLLFAAEALDDASTPTSATLLSADHGRSLLVESGSMRENMTLTAK